MYHNPPTLGLARETDRQIDRQTDIRADDIITAITHTTHVCAFRGKNHWRKPTYNYDNLNCGFQVLKLFT